MKRRLLKLPKRDKAEAVLDAAERVAGRKKPDWNEYYRLLTLAARMGSWHAKSTRANLLLQKEPCLKRWLSATSSAQALVVLKRVALRDFWSGAMANFQIASAYAEGNGVKRNVGKASLGITAQ